MPARPKAPGPLLLRGVVGAVIGAAGVASPMPAARIGQPGAAAALRETSVRFAAIIGRLLPGGRVGLPRAMPMGLIVAGAVLTQAGQGRRRSAWRRARSIRG